MLALFCLRLALGLLAALLLLRPAQINPRFYRTHFLTVLGLGCLALALIAAQRPPPLALVAVLVLAALGSVSWSLEGAPGGRTLIVLALLAVAAALLADRLPGQSPAETSVGQEQAWAGVADDLLTSALLGVA